MRGVGGRGGGGGGVMPVGESLPWVGVGLGGLRGGRTF